VHVLNHLATISSNRKLRCRGTLQCIDCSRDVETAWHGSCFQYLTDGTPCSRLYMSSHTCTCPSLPMVRIRNANSPSSRLESDTSPQFSGLGIEPTGLGLSVVEETAPYTDSASIDQSTDKRCLISNVRLYISPHTLVVNTESRPTHWTHTEWTRLQYTPVEHKATTATCTAQQTMFYKQLGHDAVRQSLVSVLKPSNSPYRSLHSRKPEATRCYPSPNKLQAGS